jgi:5'-3' exonuclease
MGILGLLQGLKYVSHQGHIRDYAGQNVAVDASSWLHKSVYSIADYYVETTETTNAVDNRCGGQVHGHVLSGTAHARQHSNKPSIVMDGALSTRP